LLVEKKPGRTRDHPIYTMVGYTTLYKFINFPVCDFRQRLSQILILPPYQRRGHGQALLQVVYGLTAQNDCVETTVEDPSPIFQIVRDLTDVQNCKKKGFFLKKPGEKPRSLDALDADYAKVVRASLRITELQVRRCYEVFRLSSTDMQNEWLYKEYRMDVKKRLAKAHAEELAVLSGDGRDRRARLHQIYKDLEEAYFAVTKRAKLR